MIYHLDRFSPWLGKDHRLATSASRAVIARALLREKSRPGMLKILTEYPSGKINVRAHLVRNKWNFPDIL